MAKWVQRGDRFDLDVVLRPNVKQPHRRAAFKGSEVDEIAAGCGHHGRAQVLIHQNTA